VCSSDLEGTSSQVRNFADASQRVFEVVTYGERFGHRDSLGTSEYYQAPIDTTFVITLM
jgi:hypothetical protein